MEKSRKRNITTWQKGQEKFYLSYCSKERDSTVELSSTKAAKTAEALQPKKSEGVNRWKSLRRTWQDNKGGKEFCKTGNRILLKAGKGLGYQGCRMRHLIRHEGRGGSPKLIKILC